MSRAAFFLASSLFILSCSASDGAASGTDAAQVDTVAADDTSAPPATLSLSPSPVYFGATLGGTPKVLSVLAVNVGTVPATVGTISTVGSRHPLRR